jgi:putative cro repressor
MGEYDYGKLLGRIKEKHMTQDDLAKKMGIRSSTLSQKLNNKARFKQSEISMACDILEITANDIGDYFFAH